eukprot:m.127769 g.127769  ORF g.127769 m.127769 type:complete len:76 (+) comp15663_c1_seq6:803-1030(+)
MLPIPPYEAASKQARKQEANKLSNSKEGRDNVMTQPKKGRKKNLNLSATITANREVRRAVGEERLTENEDHRNFG